MKNSIKLILLAIVILFTSFKLIEEKPSTATINLQPLNKTLAAITITNPVGGQDYCLNKQQYIEWETTGGTIPSVSIYLMDPNGLTIDRTLVSDVSNNGRYLWNGDASSLGNYLIKISGFLDLTDDLITGQTGAFTLKDCQKPDLRVGTIEILPQSPGEGQRVTFKGNVMNYGENPVENPVVTLKVTRPAGLATQTFTKEMEITLTKNQGITFVKEFRVRKPGNYTVTFILDPANSVDEINENNNEKDRTFVVRPLPDLIVCIDNGKRPPVGRKREIRMVVKNIGNESTNTPLKGIQLRSYVEGKGVKMYDILPLGPGSSFTIKRNHSWGKAGTKTISARIIYPNAEINSDNNEAKGSYFVRLPHHDKYSTAPKVKCSTGKTFYNWEDSEN